jgi:hypothetical protein
MHGYSATKYDASVVKPPKNLRRQFGHSYYQKKDRNTSGRRLASGAFERDARVGEWAAVSRPVQRAQWSDADGKLNE